MIRTYYVHNCFWLYLKPELCNWFTMLLLVYDQFLVRLFLHYSSLLLLFLLLLICIDNIAVKRYAMKTCQMGKNVFAKKTRVLPEHFISVRTSFFVWNRQCHIHIFKSWLQVAAILVLFYFKCSKWIGFFSFSLSLWIGV